MSHRTKTQKRPWQERALSLLLAAALLIGLAPGLAPSASAHWADSYLDQLVDWGILRADQTSDPDAPITRADFAAILNRAYGYTQTGPIPFEDVSVDDWFYDDISIAYNAGYMAGTSATTVSPNDPLTREMAICLLGRNMMLEETPGESLAFTDSRNVSSWARGTIKTAVDQYIIAGYPDNSFGPQDSITKAQMAVWVTNCLGQPVTESGVHSLGGVFGNVTITSPDVTLRDTTISGDLYISGGVGLGGILLENVNVLGRIIVSGTGESEAGDASVVMRNVTANEMLVDNLKNQYVTIRADGITEIAKTTVRTSAYLEDNNPDDKGLLQITLDGEDGLHLDLAGRLKEVVNKTPGSTVQLAKGTLQKLTVDEAAVNSGVVLDRNTEVKELNLDVATGVTGQGDIEQLNINAAGSNVAMLPDKIYIRPGLTAIIAGEVMDSAGAEEASKDPRLLSGYPVANDVAPTGLQGVFATNKKGTVYWAVSNITDGSVDADSLIKPPSYGSIAVVNGSVAVPTADTDVSAQITGLTTGGSYYLSAVVVDGQGKRSPVKVISFTTPDSTVPAFAQGYPYMSLITDTMAQVTVMPTKSCKLYYAVLPQGAQAPTPAELKSASVVGNLGYGVVDVVKNTERVINVSHQLEELKDYVLYLWLTDANGANSSAVTSVPFKTVDKTPPEFVITPYAKQIQAQAVQMNTSINENGTIFWAVVESGTDYPKPNAQNPADNEEDGRTAKLDSDYAKLQVANGMNCLQKGSIAATANTEVTLNISGLEPEKAYDLYYLAQDTAGNYSIQVYKLADGVHTLDTSGPVVTQKFTKYSGLDETQDPMNDTDIILEFNEMICTEGAIGQDLLTLYQKTQEGGSVDEQEAALDAFTKAIRDSFTLYQQVTGTMDQAVKVKGDPGVDENTWVIDYEKVRVENVDGKARVIFPSEGLQLDSGSTYFFTITGITDNSDAKNRITPRTVQDDEASRTAGHNVPRFTVVFARLFMTQIDLVNGQWPDKVQAKQPSVLNPDDTTQEYQYNVDFSFRVIPDATSTVATGMAYDLLFWTDTTIRYDLYYRVVKSSERDVGITKNTWLDKNGKDQYYTVGNKGTPPTTDTHGWVYLGDSNEILTDGKELFGRNLQGKYFNKNDQGSYPEVNTLDDLNSVYYEFAVCIRKMGTGTSSVDPATWSGEVNFYVDAVAGTSGNLFRLNTGLSEDSLEDFVAKGLGGGGGVAIGSTDNRENPKRLHMSTPFSDSLQPSFAQHFPTFEAGSTTVDMSLTLDRPGTVYYAIAPADLTGQELNDETKWVPTIETLVEDAGGGRRSILPSEVPTSGDNANLVQTPKLLTPEKGNIFRPQEWAEATKAITGSVDYRGVVTKPETVDGLEPNRTYYVYLVITGSAREPSEVEIYKFKTNPPARPLIDLSSVTGGGAGGANMTITNMDAYLSYLTYPEDDFEQIIWMSDATKLVDVIKAEYKDRLPTKYESYTLLQALTNPYYYGQASDGNNNADAYFPEDGAGNVRAFDGYSVFDIYASGEVKQTIANWITTGTIQKPSMGVVPDSNPTVGQKETEIQMTEDEPRVGGSQAHVGTQYYIITIARSRSSNSTDSADSIYSFMALPYAITDQEPPDLRDASGMFSVENSSGTLDGGTITLTFNKALYHGKDIEIKTGLAFFGTDAWPTGVESAVVKNEANGSTVTIKLVDSTKSIRLPVVINVGIGNLTNASGVPSNKTLKIEIYEDTATSGSQAGITAKTYYMTITWTDGTPLGTQTWGPYRGSTS